MKQALTILFWSSFASGMTVSSPSGCGGDSELVCFQIVFMILILIVFCSLPQMMLNTLKLPTMEFPNILEI